MNTNSITDCPEIQDTLFGEPQVSKVEADIDGDCHCICSCRTQTVKIPNGELTAATIWFGDMPVE